MFVRHYINPFVPKAPFLQPLCNFTTDAFFLFCICVSIKYAQSVLLWFKINNGKPRQRKKSIKTPKRSHWQGIKRRREKLYLLLLHKLEWNGLPQVNKEILDVKTNQSYFSYASHIYFHNNVLSKFLQVFSGTNGADVLLKAMSYL